MENKGFCFADCVERASFLIRVLQRRVSNVLRRVTFLVCTFRPAVPMFSRGFRQARRIGRTYNDVRRVIFTVAQACEDVGFLGRRRPFLSSKVFYQDCVIEFIGAGARRDDLNAVGVGPMSNP